MIRGSLTLLLCVGLLFATCHDHHEAPHYKYSKEANILPNLHTAKHKLRVESPVQLWLETGAAVLLISLAPFLFLCFLPDLNKHHRLLNILLAFAAGGLLGDAFLHLIPHAIDHGRSDHEHSHTHDHDHHDEHSHDHHHHHHHTVVGLSVVAGIFVFLFIEKLIRLVQHGSGSHNHSSHQQSTTPTAPTMTGNSNAAKNKKGKHANNNTSEPTAQKRDKKALKPKQEFRVAGYLNLAADFTHNFTDGLAIGASFLVSRNLGMVTTATVLFHELPHEIGDYAILIQSGCSARKAMLLQLVTAIGAALGAALSLLAAGVGVESVVTMFNLPHFTENMVNAYVLPFTAGGFIYIAMTSVLPDLLSDAAGAHNRQAQSGFLSRFAQSVAEALALVSGIGVTILLSAME